MLICTRTLWPPMSCSLVYCMLMRVSSPPTLAGIIPLVLLRGHGLAWLTLRQHPSVIRGWLVRSKRDPRSDFGESSGSPQAAVRFAIHQLDSLHDSSTPAYFCIYLHGQLIEYQRLCLENSSYFIRALLDNSHWHGTPCRSSENSYRPTFLADTWLFCGDT